MNVTTDPGWGKKTIWLRDLAEVGPVLMRFTHGVVPSKFPDRIPFAPFRLLGDDTKYALQVETKQLEGWLTEVPVMSWVIVEYIPVDLFNVTVLEAAPGSMPTAPPFTRRPVAAFEETLFDQHGAALANPYVICDDGAVFLGQYAADGSTHLDAWVEATPIPGTPREAQLADD